MDILNEHDEPVEIELGAASTETRGIGLGKRDSLEEQFPVEGLTDD